MLDIKDFKIIDKSSRRAHLSYAFSKCEVPGEILEFGVYKGGTINHLATLTNKTINGFDSFEGLPEPWKWSPQVTHPPERFEVREIPEVADNIQLHKGWFTDTIADWKYYNSNPIQFLHIDSDLYSSCKHILCELNDQIVIGTIIVFDELFNYPCWKEGEYKALIEWLEEFNREVIPLGRTGKYAASVKVIK